jgi:hypothetical protein
MATNPVGVLSALGPTAPVNACAPGTFDGKTTTKPDE